MRMWHYVNRDYRGSRIQVLVSAKVQRRISAQLMAKMADEALTTLGFTKLSS